MSEQGERGYIRRGAAHGGGKAPDHIPASEHGDTIRRTLGFLPPTMRLANGRRIDRMEIEDALDALLAERQQAIEALREIAEYGEKRDFQLYAGSMAGMARHALTKLGEQPK